jgi:hypothetical protein
VTPSEGTTVGFLQGVDDDAELSQLMNISTPSWSGIADVAAAAGTAINQLG